MIIDALPVLPSAPSTGDEIPIERGTNTYKVDYNALAADVVSRLGGSPVPVDHGGTGSTTAAGARANLGLGYVDNTSDADKPISNATQEALNLKFDSYDAEVALAHKQDKLTFDDAPTEGSDNPVKSGGIKTALGQLMGDVYTRDEADALLADKQDTEAGKGLSANDFTDPLRKKLEDDPPIVEMTKDEYNALSDAEKMDGSVRFITDVDDVPDVPLVEMTKDAYNALSDAEKMDGSVRFITDVDDVPDVPLVEMTKDAYNALSDAEKMDGSVRFITDVDDVPDVPLVERLEALLTPENEGKVLAIRGGRFVAVDASEI